MKRALPHPRSTLIALVAALMPLIALAGDEPTGAPSNEELFYLVQGDLSGDVTDGTTLRFEYRSGESVLSTHEVRLRIRRDETKAVSVPRPIQIDVSNTPEPEVLVFADGLLLARFDRQSLLDYNRTIRYTHARALAEQVGRRSFVPDPSAGVRSSANLGICGSPCDGGCLPHEDFDCDGVANSVDNCTDDPNANQANCDGDAQGDVCDLNDGIFQPTGPVETCHTDKDDHVHIITWEHHVEQRLVDVTSCGSPDQWDHWVRFEDDCGITISDFICCNELANSIGAVGDDPDLWCGQLRDQNLCH